MAVFPPRERDAFMAHWGSILRDASGVVRTIELDGTVAGNIVLFWFEGRREVGYWVGREFWGRASPPARSRRSWTRSPSGRSTRGSPTPTSPRSACSRSAASR